MEKPTMEVTVMTAQAKPTSTAEDALRILEDSFAYYLPEAPVVAADATPRDYTPYAEAA